MKPGFTGREKFMMIGGGKLLDSYVSSRATNDCIAQSRKGPLEYNQMQAASSSAVLTSNEAIALSENNAPNVAPHALLTTHHSPLTK
ncbi:MAG TPA: hypothetical protein VFT90_04170 [Chryseosolibacter sp.]|nr:hypothetical protein [Chryseosolibacter sp.]